MYGACWIDGNGHLKTQNIDSQLGLTCELLNCRKKRLRAMAQKSLGASEILLNSFILLPNMEESVSSRQLILSFVE